jgi:hypothetical protein
MATNVNIPIPQNPIGENYPWRDWFQKLSNKVFGTVASQDANNIAVTGGSLNATVIGLNTPAAAEFTTIRIITPLSASSGGTGLSSPGTTGNVLTSNGTSWVSSPSTGGVSPVVYAFAARHG